MQHSPDSFSEDIMSLITKLAGNTDIESIISAVMEAAANIADADGSFFFHATTSKFINLIYSRIASLKISLTGTANMQLFPSVFISDIRENPAKQPAEACIINQEIVNLTDIFAADDFDTTQLREFAAKNNYTVISLLAFPLFDSRHNVIGAAQFFNARDNSGRTTGFTSDDISKMTSICQLAAFALERKKLAESYTQLLESFIDVLAKAIDDKSPYTGLHCQRVPIITRMLASAAVSQTEGPFKNFEMSDDDWYALHIASWLHDCGKIVTPEYLIDKASKLETVTNRIHEIRDRFEILRRDTHIEYLQKRLQNIDSKENLQAEFVSKVKQLTEDFEFIGRCNIGDTPLTTQDIKRIDEISQRCFTRYFNRMAGLSWGEKKLIDKPEDYAKPEIEHLLQDRPEQINSFYNQGELTNLKVLQGTINPAERQKINEHIITTINILKDLPFPPELSNIVEYAGAHHERVDGKGYPNGLTGDEMSIPAKIMAIADVFEALTANDRPYKEPKKLSEVLRIMQNMKNSGHLDPDLYDLFIQSGVYLDYAREYIDAKQIDEINPEEFL